MFLDFAFAVFASTITASIFHEAVTWQLVCLGLIFIFIPDIDFYIRSIRKIDHRSFLHYPFFYIVASVLILVFGNTEIAFLFFITTLFHFIHDTLILGWGVAWFAPVSYRRYKLFPDNGMGGFLKEKFLTWLPSEQEQMEQILNDPYWIKNWYCKVTVVSVVEYTAFFSAVMYVIYTL